MSSEAFVWTRLYLAEVGDLVDPQLPLWWCLRRRRRDGVLSRRPMTYEALRAVLRRVNRLLGSNWSMHDLRHTAALRMSRDERLSLVDVQRILGHVHLSTTADVYLVEAEDRVIERVHEHLSDRAAAPVGPAVSAASGYDSEDLRILFGGGIV